MHRGSSSSEISSISTTSASLKLNKRKTRLTSTHFGKSRSRTSIKHPKIISSLPSSASSNGANKRKINCTNLNRKQNAHKYRLTTNLDSNHTSRSSSTDSSATPLKRKQVSFRLVEQTFLGLFVPLLESLTLTGSCDYVILRFHKRWAHFWPLCDYQFLKDSAPRSHVA